MRHACPVPTDPTDDVVAALGWLRGPEGTAAPRLAADLLATGATCCTGWPACAPRSGAGARAGPHWEQARLRARPARCSAATPTSCSSPPTRSSRPAARSSPPGARPGCWRAGRPGRRPGLRHRRRTRSARRGHGPPAVVAVDRDPVARALTRRTSRRCGRRGPRDASRDADVVERWRGRAGAGLRRGQGRPGPAGAADDGCWTRPVVPAVVDGGRAPGRACRVGGQGGAGSGPRPRPGRRSRRSGSPSAVRSSRRCCGGAGARRRGGGPRSSAAGACLELHRGRRPRVAPAGAVRGWLHEPDRRSSGPAWSPRGEQIWARP